VSLKKNNQIFEQMSNVSVFLQSYVRLHNEAICRLPVHARQVVVLTVVNGQWVWGYPTQPAGDASWCRSALTSMLNLGPTDYERVKHELFHAQIGLNGVYKHKSENIFAIVYEKKKDSAVAFFPEQQPNKVAGHVTFEQSESGVIVRACFSQLPPGEHGFHIHKAGDLRGEGCKGACDHYHVGPPSVHGDAPNPSQNDPRHTGDLGNISDAPCQKIYELKGVQMSDLYGRSVIVHADRDDLGKGNFPDSKTTGHSGSRIACAIIGRVSNCH